MRVPRSLLNCLAFAASSSFVFGQSISFTNEPTLGSAVVLGIDENHPNDPVAAVSQPVLGPIILLASNTEEDSIDVAPRTIKAAQDEILQYLPASEANELPQVVNVPNPVSVQAVPAPIRSLPAGKHEQVSLKVKFIEMNSTALSEIGTEFYSPGLTSNESLNGSATGIVETNETSELVSLLCKRGVARIVAEPTATILDGRTARLITDARPRAGIRDPFRWRRIPSKVRDFSLLATPRLLADGRIQLGLVCEFLRLGSTDVDIVFGQAALRRVETVVEVRPGQTAYMIGTTQRRDEHGDEATDLMSIMVLISAEIVHPMEDSPVAGNHVVNPVYSSNIPVPIFRPYTPASTVPSIRSDGSTSTSNASINCDFTAIPKAKQQINVPFSIAAQPNSIDSHFVPAQQNQIEKCDDPSSSAVHPDRIQTQLKEVAQLLESAGLSAEAQKIAEIQEHILREHATQLLIAFKESQVSRLQTEIAELKANQRTTVAMQPISQKPTNRGALLENTGNDLDIAIKGQGYFQILSPSGEFLYTRDGSFELNSLGQLVTSNGYHLQPPITISNDARSITIGNDGTVSVVTAGAPTTATVIGNLVLSRFAEPGNLSAEEGNFFAETSASGSPEVGSPGANGFGSIRQGHLEISRERALENLGRLITSLRGIESRFADHQITHDSRNEERIKRIVILKAKIFEIDPTQYADEFTLLGLNDPSVTLENRQIERLIDVIRDKKHAQILSAPTMIIPNGENARVFAGEQASTGQEIGIALSAKPTLLADGIVQLETTCEISYEADDGAIQLETAQGRINVPGITKTQMAATQNVQIGHSLAIVHHRYERDGTESPKTLLVLITPATGRSPADPQSSGATATNGRRSFVIEAKAVSDK